MCVLASLSLLYRLHRLFFFDEFSGDYKAYIKARKELPRDKKTSSYTLLWKRTARR
jgi:hypothetical protein